MVVYWYKAGSLNTDQYLRQQLKIVKDLILSKKTSGALLRLSVDIKNDDEAATLKLIKEFCGEIEPLVEKYVP